MPDSVAPEPAAPTSSPAAGTRAPLSGIDIFAFLCQMFAFASLALWGFASWPFPWNIVAGIGAPVAAILVWALFVSPRAVVAVHPFIRAVVEILVYVSATLAWWSLGYAWIGVAFAVIAVTAGVLSGRRRFA
jgi:hypothetical protein